MAEGQGGVPPAGQPAPPAPLPQPSSGRGRRALIAAVVVAAVAVAGLGGWYFLGKPRYPWLFRGAYADYEGSAVALFIPVNVKLHVEVLDYNSTHAKLLMRWTISAFGNTETEENVTWVELGKGTYIVDDEEPDKTYEATIELEGVGKRDCVVYVYEDPDSQSTFKIYVDKKTVWPVKFELNSPLFNVDLELKDTNIKALKK